MRNTFVKLFLALAMCFMVCGALIACGDSAVTLDVVDGYFVVNGVKTNVKQGDRLDDCTHDIVKVEVKDHKAGKDGWVLEACTKCADYAKVYEDTIHDWEDGEIAATCTEAGFVGKICAICNAQDEANGEVIPALGHDYVEEKATSKVLAADGKTALPACTNDAVVVKHCQVCYHVDDPEIVLGGVGHVVPVWGTYEYPELNKKGKAYGTCTYCEKTVYYDLPVLADANYKTEWIGDEPTCTEGAWKSYQYEAKDVMNEVTKVWDTNLAFATEYKHGPMTHQLAGKDYTEWKKAGTSYINFYDDVDGNGIVDDGEKTGIKAFADDVLKCGTDALAYFICEACNEVVDVTTYVDHNGPTKVIKTAYCCVPGETETTCNECKTVITDKEVYADHDYENGYTLTVSKYGKDENGNEVPVEFALDWECPNVGIKTTEIVDPATGKKTVKEEKVECKFTADTKYIPAASLDDIEFVPANCYNGGYTVWQYIDEDGKVFTAKVAGKKTAHTLNGELVEDLSKVDVATAGVKMFADRNITVECGKVYKNDFYFVCSVCAAAQAAGLVDTSVVDLPNIQRAHKLDEEITKEATCTKTGLKNVKCSYTGCLEAEKDVVIPAAGHDFSNAIAKLTKVPNANDSYMVTINATCAKNCDEENNVVKVENKLLPAITDSAYETKLVSGATCSSGSITKYTLYLDLAGNPAKYELDEDKNRVYATPYVSVSFDVFGADIMAHDFNYDLKLESTVENDYNKDGIIDRIELVTFHYCKACLAYKTSNVKTVEELTDIGPDWKPEEDAE